MLCYWGNPSLTVGAPIRAPSVSERVCGSTESRGQGPSPGVDRAMMLRLPKLNQGGRPLGRISRHLRSVSDPSRDTPVTSQPIAHVVLPGGLPVWIRTPHGTLDVHSRKWLGACEAIIEACPPIATAFNRWWMPFRTLRCRWPFLFLRNWVSGKSSMPRLRPSWIWPVRNLSLIHISEPTRLGMISYA